MTYFTRMTNIANLALRAFFALLWVLLSVHAYAGEAAPLAADEKVEKRMVEISEEMRCLVCQNESLSGSHAELAQDLRREIRTMIKQGKSNEEIMEFMVSRYGDFVRYRPPVKATTYLLWFGPFLLMAGAIAVLVIYLRRRGARVEEGAEGTLSVEERQQAEALLISNKINKSENQR
jgi:cytochrome c-type biogenesis protein CcmH